MPAPINLTGQRFGRLTVKAADPERGSGGRIRWLCVCDCGTERVVSGQELRLGKTSSCGCYRREILTVHGHCGGKGHSRTYTTWLSMIQRCTNPKAEGFKDYGGRGVAVCDRWRRSFAAFLEDMGERPAGLSIDRIDNDKNYEPGNCRWATQSEQNRNQKPPSLATRAKRAASGRGKTHSAETREKIGAARRGRPGKPHSAETLAKISAANKGKHLSAETRARISAARRLRVSAH